MKIVLDEALKITYNFIKVKKKKKKGFVKPWWIPLKGPLASHLSKTTNYGLDLSDKHASFC